MASIPAFDNPRLKRNNWDAVRLILATWVCFVHVFQLSRFEDLQWIQRVFSPDIPVEAFFVVSGFLIFMSYERSRSLGSYVEKRVRRIYPAYITVVLLCAFLLWTVGSLPIREYFSLTWLKYVAANAVFMNFLQHSLPGVFEMNRSDPVNGPLWTLKIEVMFYASVPVIVWLFRKLGRLKVLIALYLLSVIYHLAMLEFADRTGSGGYAVLARQLPGQLCYFLAGGFLFYHLPFFERNLKYLLPFSAVTLAVHFFHPLPWLKPFALAVAVAFFGLFNYAGNAGKYGDFSYGIYIIHWPVIQLLLHFGLLVDRPLLFLLAVLAFSFAGAFALWHLVEKRFLRRGSHYIVASEGKPSEFNSKAEAR